MSSTSRFSAVVASLAAAITAAVNNPLIPVFDGPMTSATLTPCRTSSSAPTAPTVRSAPASSPSRGPGLGARARDEMADVDCALVVLSGDEATFAGVRDTAFGLLSAMETVMRSNFATNVPGVLWQELTVGDVFQANTNRGPRVRIPFTVHFRSPTTDLFTHILDDIARITRRQIDAGLLHLDHTGREIPEGER
jgi:hypothetical protein